MKITYKDIKNNFGVDNKHHIASTNVQTMLGSASSKHGALKSQTPFTSSPNLNYVQSMQQIGQSPSNSKNALLKLEECEDDAMSNVVSEGTKNTKVTS